MKLTLRKPKFKIKIDLKAIFAFLMMLLIILSLVIPALLTLIQITAVK